MGLARRQKSRLFSAGAFTLVELLVVIGIIGLLIALLLPSLNIARQAALRTACSAKLQQVVVAAQLHALDHKGFYPLVGILPGWQPSDLEDTYSTKYDYFDFPLPYAKIPAPITFALSLEMSHRHVLDKSDNPTLGPEETDAQGLIRNFLCPAQANSVTELQQNPFLYLCQEPGNSYSWVAYNEAESYVFNEAICGWADSTTSNRLQGKASLVHQPAATMFAADGLMGSVDVYLQRIPAYAGSGMASMYNISPNPPVTLADALTNDGLAGDPENFDLLRHRGKINIGFCDGHVETRSINASELAKIYLLAP